jgi:hypothetical protein
MKKPKIDDEQMGLLRDLSLHAARKSHVAVRDACQFIDDPEHCYSLAMNVIASMLCTAARGLPGRKSHVQKIAAAYGHLAQLLAHHRDHGEHC